MDLLHAKDPSLYSNTVTAIMVPEGFDSTDVVKQLTINTTLPLGED